MREYAQQVCPQGLGAGGEPCFLPPRNLSQHIYSPPFSRHLRHTWVTHAYCVPRPTGDLLETCCKGGRSSEHGLCKPRGRWYAVGRTMPPCPTPSLWKLQSLLGGTGGRLGCLHGGGSVPSRNLLWWSWSLHWAFLPCGPLTPQGTPPQLTLEAGPGEGSGVVCTYTGSPSYCGLCGPFF